MPPGPTEGLRILAQHRTDVSKRDYEERGRWDCRNAARYSPYVAGAEATRDHGQCAIEHQKNTSDDQSVRVPHFDDEVGPPATAPDRNSDDGEAGKGGRDLGNAEDEPFFDHELP